MNPDKLLFAKTHEWVNVTEQEGEKVATMLDVNLTGALTCVLAAKDLMSRNGGRILNIASIMGLFGAPSSLSYSVAKAGLVNMTRCLACDLADSGITVNAIAPGFIETDMTKATAARIGITFDELVQASVAQIPVGRSGKPEDIANTAAFFADEASSFVNGQVIYVAGGPKD